MHPGCIERRNIPVFMLFSLLLSFPIKLTSAVQEYTVKLGSTVTLQCVIVFPGGKIVDHIIQWKRADIEVPVYIKFNGHPPHIDDQYKDRASGDFRLELVGDASLKITNIRVSDEGRYSCQVMLLDRPEEENQNHTVYHLRIQTSPQITHSSPGLLHHKIGDTVTMFCDARGSPTPSLKWTHNGNVLTTGGKYSIFANKLKIRHVERIDGGPYKCIFQNRFSSDAGSVPTVNTVEKMIGLVVEGGAYIMNPPVNRTVIERHQVRLFCEAEAVPNNITYRWYKNGYDVMTVSALRNRAVISGDGSLVISPVLKGDSGWYRCRPSNGLGQPPEAHAYLNVVFKPMVFDVPQRLYFPKGMSDSIPCPAMANPPIEHILWYKDDHQLTIDHDRRLSLSEDWSLVILDVDMSDAGRYFCVPRNELGTGKASNTIRVIVRDPPYFTIRPKTYYQQILGKSITFPCAATGIPLPTITWKKVNGQFASERSEQRGGNLTISNLVKSDHGIYECIAENEVTSVLTSAKLIIELTTPHAPLNVTVVTTQFSAMVSWQPAYDGGFAQHYVLWFKHVSPVQQHSDWQTLQVIPSDATTFSVYNLSPDAQYTFMVLSRNKLGNGLFSESLNVKTLGDRVQIEDTAPPVQTQGTVVVPTPTTSSLNSVLQHCQHKHQRGYVPGLSLPSDANGVVYIPNIIRKLGPIPSPPTNVTAHAIGNDRVRVTWNAPNNATVSVSCYTIEYRTKTGWVLYNKPLLPNMTSHTITDSRLVEAYQIRVISYTPTAYSVPSIEAVLIRDIVSPEHVGISNGAVAGIVTGLVLFLIILMSALIACKLCSKDRIRFKENGMKYGNVQQYFGPQAGVYAPNNNERYEKWSEEDGNGFQGVGGMTNENFTLPSPYRDISTDNLIPIVKLNRPDDDVDVASVSKLSRGRSPQYAIEIDFTHPICQISRAPDGRFRTDSAEKFSCHQRNVNDIISTANGPKSWSRGRYPINHRVERSQYNRQQYLYRYPTHSETASNSRSHSVPVTEYSSLADESMSNRSKSIPPELHVSRVPCMYQYRNARLIPRNDVYMQQYSRQWQRNPEEDSDQGSFRSIDDAPITPHNGVILRPMVRHSTMKPFRLDRTYMTSSPQDEMTYSLNPFHFDTDLSTVDPSSNATTRSKLTLPSSSTLPSDKYLPSSSTLPSDKYLPSSSTLPSSSSWGNGSPVFAHEMSISRPIDPTQFYRHGPHPGTYTCKSVPQQAFRVHKLQYPRVLTPTRDRKRAEQDRDDNESEGSSGSHIGYSRDMLQGAVEKVRMLPLERHGYPSETVSREDLSETPRSPVLLSNTAHSFQQPLSTRYMPRVRPYPARQNHDANGERQQSTVLPVTYEASVAPYKDKRVLSSCVRLSVTSASSGRGSTKLSLTHSRPELSNATEQSPENGSSSSGVVSRDTSQSTVSTHGRGYSMGSNSCTPCDISGDSILNQCSTEHKRDVSGDENYEFDSMSGLENELLDALKNYSSHVAVDKSVGARIKSAEVVSEVSADRINWNPKQEERCAKLREEYQTFCRRMRLQEFQNSSLWDEAESEML